MNQKLCDKCSYWKCSGEEIIIFKDTSCCWGKFIIEKPSLLNQISPATALYNLPIKIYVHANVLNDQIFILQIILRIK